MWINALFIALAGFAIYGIIQRLRGKGRPGWTYIIIALVLALAMIALLLIAALNIGHL